MQARRFRHGIGDGARLYSRSSGYDGEGVGQNGSTAYVECRETLSLFVERALANDVDQLADARTSGETPSATVSPKLAAAASVAGTVATPLRAL